MENNGTPLRDRKLYLHPMTQVGARLLAAAFRSVDIDAEVLPHSDERTMELGNMYSSGEECLPEKVTLGDYLKLTETEGFDPDKAAFLMPSANGPCRFGQYAELLSDVLKKQGLGDIMIVSPSSKNVYSNIGGSQLTFFRTSWIALIASDILRKMVLKIRPYEKVSGSADAVYETGIVRAEKVLEKSELSYKKRLELLRDELIRSRDEFRAVDAEYIKGKPLLGVLGEIFCRHNRFANENMIRKLEEHGAETWIADVSEWIFYTSWSQRNNMIRHGKKYTPGMFKIKLKEFMMKKDEHILLKPFHDDFVGYEEPSDTEEVVGFSEPYLPAGGTLGEMTMSLGRSGYLSTKGVDGIVDISPFSCMNGIVSEAVYPSFSQDYDDIPCRVFFFDGVNLDMDRDIGIFMELVRGYMSRKKIERKYPDFFIDG